MKSSRFLRCLRLMVSDPETVFFALAGVGCVSAPIAVILRIILADPEVVKRHLPAAVQGLPVVLIALAVYLPFVVLGSLMNAAVIGCYVKRFQGGEPTISDGLKTIAANFGAWLEICLLTCGAFSILIFFASCVRAEEEEKNRVDFTARLLLASSSEAMFAASAFVLCIMIVERCRFLEAAHRAAALKEQFAKIFQLGLFSHLALAMPVFLWEIGLAVLLKLDYVQRLSLAWMITLSAGVPLLLFLGSAVVLAIVNLAYTCAVYLGATRQDEATRRRIAGYFPEALAVAVEAVPRP